MPTGWVVVALVGWWVSTRGAGYRLIPAPGEVGVALWDLAFGGINDDAFSGMLLTHLVASASRVYGAFLLAAMVALPLGMAIGRVWLARALFDPALQVRAGACLRALACVRACVQAYEG